MFSVKINCSLCGFSQGARGLRQGDSLSPYLFVIVIEVLALILAKGSQNSLFRFHWRTSACKITHLCFTDDVLVFCHGDPNSVNIIKSCLQTLLVFWVLTKSLEKFMFYG